MRLTQKKIDEVIIRILDENGLRLVELLKDRENVSEFDIAKELDLDIKVVRKMLYLLYNNNLVSFTRKKDKQKGWYIYYWTILNESLKYEYIKRKKELVIRFKEQLHVENIRVFFLCAEECVRLDFDESMEFEFRCPECGKLLEQDNNEKRVERLKNRVSDIEKELAEIEKSEKRRRLKERQKAIEDKAKELAREKAEEKKLEKKKLAEKKKKADDKKKIAKKKKEAKKKAAIEKANAKKINKKKIVKKKSIEKKKKVAKKKKVTRIKAEKKATKKKIAKKKK